MGVIGFTLTRRLERGRWRCAPSSARLKESTGRSRALAPSRRTMPKSVLTRLVVPYPSQYHEEFSTIPSVRTELPAPAS
eukprot:2313268-Rhodomonas_salina.2